MMVPNLYNNIFGVITEDGEHSTSKLPKDNYPHGTVDLVCRMHIPDNKVNKEKD